MLDDTIEISYRSLVYALIAFAIIFAVIVALGHIYPQQFDNFGDRWFGPVLYGRQPN